VSLYCEFSAGHIPETRFVLVSTDDAD